MLGEGSHTIVDPWKILESLENSKLKQAEQDFTKTTTFQRCSTKRMGSKPPQQQLQEALQGPRLLKLCSFSIFLWTHSSSEFASFALLWAVSHSSTTCSEIRGYPRINPIILRAKSHKWMLVISCLFGLCAVSCPIKVREGWITIKKNNVCFNAVILIGVKCLRTSLLLQTCTWGAPCRHLNVSLFAQTPDIKARPCSKLKRLPAEHANICTAARDWTV